MSATAKPPLRFSRGTSILLLILATAGIVGLTAAATGLFNRTYTVVGVVTRDGHRLHWPKDVAERKLHVQFVHLDRQRYLDPFTAEADEQSGQFRVLNLPAGTYRVAIQQMAPYPLHDLLGFVFDFSQSPFIYTVAGDATINIDLPAKLPPARRPGLPGALNPPPAERLPPPRVDRAD
jgi:hypothetical protein